MKILLVEDDPIFLDLLKQQLMAQGYTLDVVSDGEQAWRFGSTFDYDLIILDVLLPSLDGLSLCSRFREEGYTTPILLLTAQDTSAFKVQGLDLGADDYVVKPFDMAELMARIRALLRRGMSQPLPLLTWGELSLNPSRCEVIYQQQMLNLTSKEYELLELLLRHNPQVLSHDEILDRLWASEDFPSEATVRSHIRRLRQKLKQAGAPPDFIATIHGRGYYLKPMDMWEPQGQELPPSPPTPSPVSSQALQQQYLAALNQTWQTARPQSLQQITELQRCLGAIGSAKLQGIASPSPSAANPSPGHYSQARLCAHQLAGKLGIFGLASSGQLAKQIEDLLCNPPLQASQITQIHQWANQIHQDVQVTLTLSSLPSLPVIPATPSSPLPAPKILLVDDDVAWLRTLAPLLESLGFKPSTLADPSQFWDVLGSIQPDALVLDVDLSPWNGMDLCKRLRQESRWHRLPVLFVSVINTPEVQAQAFAVGADDYICKPTCGAILGIRIRNRLQRLQAWSSGITASLGGT